MLHRRMPLPSLSLIVVLLTLGLAPHAHARSLAAGPSEVEPAAAGEPKLEMVGQIGGVTGVVAAQDGYAYMDIGTRLAVVSVGDPRRPVQLGQSALFPEAVNDIVVAGRYAYLAHEKGLRVIDVSNPAFPGLVAFLPMAGPLGILATGRDESGQLWLYAIREELGLYLVDISDPRRPEEAAFIETASGAHDVAVVGQHVYVAGGYEDGVQIVDVSDPTAPRLTGASLYARLPHSIAVAGEYLYLLDSPEYETYALSVYDVSDPAAPVRRAQRYWVPPSPYIQDMTAEGSSVYIVTGGHLTVLDVSDPELPVQAGAVAAGGWRVASDGPAVYVATESGLQVVDVSDPARPVTHAFSHVLFRQPSSFAVGRFDDPRCPVCAFVATSDSQLHIVDVSVSTAPRLVESISLPQAATIRLQGNSLYLWTSAAYDIGYLFVFDVSDPTAPQEIGSYSMQGGIMDVVVRGRYAYLSVLDFCPYPRGGCDEDTGGLRVLDLANPAAPVEVGRLDVPAMEPWAIALSSPESPSQYAYVAGTRRLWIIDVTEATSPVLIGQPAYPEPWLPSEVPSGIAVMGEYLYLATRGQGLKIAEVTDAARPRWIRSMDLGAMTFGIFVHGTRLYVAEGVVFESEQGGGPHVLDISDPEHPTVVASQGAPRRFHAVVVEGDYAYFLGAGPGLTIYAVADTGAEQVRIGLPLMLRR